MQRFKHHWLQLPRSTRRPLVFILGTLLILLSGLVGWLPGPGGMVPFLLGIAVLATEFTWAERLRDWIMERLHSLRSYLTKEPLKGWVAVVLVIASVWLIAYAFYMFII